MSTDPSRDELSDALRHLRACIQRAAGLGLAAGLLVLAPSWYMLEVYDRVVNSRSTLTLAMLTLAVLGAYVVMEVLEWARAQIMFAAACEFDQRLGKRVFAAGFEAQRKRIAGGGLQAVQDLHTLRDFLHSPAVLAVMEAPVSVVLLALIFAIHPLLGGVALATAGVQVFVGWLNQRATRQTLNAANRQSFAAQQDVDRMQLHAPVVAAMGMLGALRRRWLERQGEAVDLQARASRRGGAIQAVSKMLQNFVNSALLGLSCWLLLHDDLHGGGGMLVVAGIFGARMLAPFLQALTQWSAVVAAREAWLRLQRLLAAVPQAPAAMPLPAPVGRLTVDNLVAAAPGAPVPVLKGLSFALERGEVLVVMGPSGAGKSCLARLLLGVWPAAAGKVRLDGVDVFAWDKAELGPHLGYLPQGVELVEGTIADNVCRFGAPDREAVQAAVRGAGLEAFVASLPGGIDTWIGPGGCLLSGGQRQRVALARAIYGAPALVVLDEPNASLDEAGDAALAEVVRAGSRRGCTFVVMSHRASVLAVADKLLLLRDGQQQAFGPRDEVLAAIRQANAQLRDAAAGTRGPLPSRAAPVAAGA